MGDTYKEEILETIDTKRSRGQTKANYDDNVDGAHVD